MFQEGIQREFRAEWEDGGGGGGGDVGVCVGGGGVGVYGVPVHFPTYGSV